MLKELVLFMLSPGVQANLASEGFAQLPSAQARLGSAWTCSRGTGPLAGKSSSVGFTISMVAGPRCAHTCWLSWKHYKAGAAVLRGWRLLSRHVRGRAE